MLLCRLGILLWLWIFEGRYFLKPFIHFVGQLMARSVKNVHVAGVQRMGFDRLNCFRSDIINNIVGKKSVPGAHCYLMFSNSGHETEYREFPSSEGRETSCCSIDANSWKRVRISMKAGPTMPAVFFIGL